MISDVTCMSIDISEGLIVNPSQCLQLWFEVSRNLLCHSSICDE